MRLTFELPIRTRAWHTLSLLILCVPRSRITACPSPSLCSPDWKGSQITCVSETTSSTVKKEHMIPSPYFGHCFSTSLSLPGQLPHSSAPPLQPQTLAASSPWGFSAEPANCHLGNKRARSTEHSPEKRPDAGINTGQTLPSHASDPPHSSLLWAVAKRQEESYPSTARLEQQQRAVGGSPQPYPQDSHLMHVGAQSPVPAPCCQPAAQPPSPQPWETRTLRQKPSQESFLGRGCSCTNEPAHCAAY